MKVSELISLLSEQPLEKEVVVMTPTGAGVGYEVDFIIKPISAFRYKVAIIVKEGDG